jgi:hypothetical protein
MTVTYLVPYDDPLAPSTAAEAIDRSVSHDEIVSLDYTDALYTDLLVACEDNVDVEGEYEDMWGTTESGHEWRVYLIHPAIDEAGR